MPQRTLAVLTGFASLLVGAPVLAATVQPHPTEPGHADIFADAYGGSFSSTDNGFSNGVVTATRVDDAADQAFGAGDYTATALASYALFNQSFGYIAADGGYQNLFDFNGERSAMAEFDEEVIFARSGEGGTFASLESLNFNGQDYLATYEITGLETGAETYALFFEDMAAGDMDYNDLVVEIREGLLMAPTPSALGAGVLMLLSLGARRRARS